MRKIILILVTLILATTLINLARADFKINSNSTSIDENYVEGDFVRGRISMNFSQQRNADFTSNFDGRISLLNLLRNMSYFAGRDYKCEPESCEKSYTVEDGDEGNATVTFNPLGGRFYGFKIAEGEHVTNIREFKFGFSSDYSNSSCTNQVDIDLFDDGVVDFYNKYYVEEACGAKKYGCFKNDDEVLSGEAIIGKTLYCEKISLQAAPAYKIGAKVRKSTKGENGGGLKLRLYKINEDNSSSALGLCPVRYSAFNSDNQEVDCVVMRDGRAVASLKSFDAFACVEADNCGQDGECTSDYGIKVRKSEDSCGGEGNPSEKKITLIRDYEIYALSLKYDKLAGKEFNLTTEDYERITDKELDGDIEKYLNKTYGKVCPEDGCVIPLKISGISQLLSLKEGIVGYNTEFGAQEKNFYELEKREPIINTDNYLQLNLDKMQFQVPGTNGTHDFKLLFNGGEIANKKINVKIGFSFEIGPRFGLIGRPITFVAIHENVTSSRWNFGDGSSIISSNDNKAEHLFTKGGEYFVETTVFTKNGASSTKKFKVIIGDAKISAQRTISDYQARITGIKSEVAAFPAWIKTELERNVKITELEASLNSIKNEYELTTNGSDAKYGEIVNKLLLLNIPLSVAVIEQGKLPLEIGFDRINPNYIAEISGTQISEEQEVKNNILLWMSENYNGEIEFEKIASINNGENVELLSKYKVSAMKKNTANNVVAYLIIDRPLSSLKIGSAHEGRSLNSGATYFVLNDETENIEFLISSNTLPSAEELGIYVSPVLSDLGTTGKPFAENLFTDSEGHFKWGFFIIAMTILIVAFLTLYLLLQTWYKRSYEKHLFKNPDDIYNLINFIYNSRKSGIEDNVTKEKLKEKKWKGEQISYAFKKIDGKRTGMLEIPLFKFAENKKVKKELEKKQGGPIDTRFIKRQSFYVK